MAERTPCFRRCSTISVASPNQEGIERTGLEEVWMITDPLAILFICASLMEGVLFFLLKEAHFVSPRYRLHLVAHPVGSSRACGAIAVWSSITSVLSWLTYRPDE